MEVIGRVESGTETESNAWSSYRESQCRVAYMDVGKGRELGAEALQRL